MKTDDESNHAQRNFVQALLTSRNINALSELVAEADEVLAKGTWSCFLGGF